MIKPDEVLHMAKAVETVMAIDKTIEWLNDGNYPGRRLKVGEAIQASLTMGSSIPVTTLGDMALAGITRELLSQRADIVTSYGGTISFPPAPRPRHVEKDKP